MAAGGETRLDNLMLLCSRHHRLMHEGGFRIERDYRDYARDIVEIRVYADMRITTSP